MKVRESSSKKEVLEEMLEQGMVLVAFDARIEGVEVPVHLGKDPQLRLNLSFRFGRFLQIEEEAVEAELTFGGVPHLCRVPFAAIFLMVSHVNGDPVLFPDDVPVELLNQASGELRLRENPSPAPAEEATRPKLSLVSDPSTNTTTAAEQASEPKKQEPSTRARRSSAASGTKKIQRKKKAESESAEDADDSKSVPRDPPQKTHPGKKKRPAHLRVIK